MAMFAGNDPGGFRGKVGRGGRVRAMDIAGAGKVRICLDKAPRPPYKLMKIWFLHCDAL